MWPGETCLWVSNLKVSVFYENQAISGCCVVSFLGLCFSMLSSVLRRPQLTLQRQRESFLSHWMIKPEEHLSILSLGEK